MEATDMDMEVEVNANQQHNNSGSSSKRFALKNAIQTNFGDDYVFQIVAKEDWTSMAVSLSSNTVKFYSPVTGQFAGECSRGYHSDRINHIMFSDINNNVLHSCSSDATLRAWDTRTNQQVSCLNAGPSQEVFSFSFGGNLLAAGCKSQILFWDWRSSKQVACLKESHMDDVTQVHFVPERQNKLISASVDGLICTFDTSGQINEDNHLESVINVGTSVEKVGIFGGNYEKLWCLTHIQTLSIWDLNDSRLEASFEDARNLASNSWALDPVDYFVDCHYSAVDDRLWVIGGTSGGSLGYFPVAYGGGMRSVLSPEAVFHGGHTGVVRSVLTSPAIKTGINQTHGIFGWTGGEDGRLCCWLSDESSDVNRSWISTSLVERNTKNRQHNRHRPY